MRVAKNNVDVQMEIPGAVLRQTKNFGDASGFGKISGEYFSLAKGVDTRPLFVGLEGGVCDCPHWGFWWRSPRASRAPDIAGCVTSFPTRPARLPAFCSP